MIKRVVDWEKTINLIHANTNLRYEIVGDWHHDPWGWLELDYIVKKEPALAYSHCSASGTLRPALIDVPKENWGSRPAVVLDIRDRLIYQALVDRLSVDLIGDMTPDAYGWRLHPTAPAAGVYSRNKTQWDSYRRHLSALAGTHPVALATDLVSFFSNVPVGRLQESIQDRCSTSAVSKRLCGLVDGFAAVPKRPGLAQRSTASAVLANMYIYPLDDVLRHHARSVKVPHTTTVGYHSYARWMDDVWLFTEDLASARRAQMELDSEARALGLNPNSGKTEVYEGPELVTQARVVEHSAVDDAILSGILGAPDFTPLEELISLLLEKPEKASRTSVKFATRRMREHHHWSSASGLLLAAERMPHVADALAELFKEALPHEALQEWFLAYAASSWATHEWSVAMFARMFPSDRAVHSNLVDYFAEAVRDANTSLPLLSVAAQRLMSWDEREARSAFRDVIVRAESPHSRRVISLAALGAGETRTTVRKWLGADPENDVTLRMLESTGFGAPKVTSFFSG